MSPAHHKTSRPQAAGNLASKAQGAPGEGEMAVFSLRDTLSSIKVREANFSEFLEALKKFGPPSVK
ncbi:MAG: hypothetical protein JNJ51_10640, partial [Methylobacillus glycogenes]|nr:hypothetical protein [Methylobacillus glycogenes]